MISNEIYGLGQVWEQRDPVGVHYANDQGEIYGGFDEDGRSQGMPQR